MDRVFRFCRFAASLAVALCAVFAAPAADGGDPGPPAEAETILDGFESASDWQVVCSDGVSLACSTERGRLGNSVRLDFEFKTGAGYCIIQRPFAIDLPANGAGNYEFDFDVRAQAPVNNLEFKLADRSGESIWWVNRRAFQFPGQWTTLVNKKRHIRFAWGPSGGIPLDHVSRIEFAIASATGGRGSVWLDNLRFRTLPATRTLGDPVGAVATSSRDPESEAAQAIAPGSGSYWRPAESDESPSITIDLGGVCEIGGVTAQFPPGDHARIVRVQTSVDGAAWSDPVPAAVTRSGVLLGALGPVEAGFVRLLPTNRSGAPGPAIGRVRAVGPEFTESDNDFLFSSAGLQPRGTLPRQFLREQTYWTLIGSPGAANESLMNEEGQVELRGGGPSLEPFVRVFESNGSERLLTWADGVNSQDLVDRALPLPRVTRATSGLSLRIEPFTNPNRVDGPLFVQYTLENTSAEPVRTGLVLALRPYQVNPPSQDLNTRGGAASGTTIALDRDGVLVDGDSIVRFSEKPSTLMAVPWTTRGEAMDVLVQGDGPGEAIPGAAVGGSACAQFDLTLEPGQSHTVVAVAESAAVRTAAAPDASAVRDAYAAATDQWRRLLEVPIRVPPEAAHIVDTLRSNIAYILLNADGPSIQPGSRCYERSWIRDGCLTSNALLSFGHADLAVSFIDWYGEHLFDSGKVPCVVDRRGPDPVPENDSDGEFIFAVMNAYRFTHDRAILERHWEHVRAAVSHIQSLRAQRLADTFSAGGPARQEPGRPPVPALAFRGLMPESISHEGYSAKPMHSYWDDWFTLRGLSDACDMAGVLGMNDEHARLAALRGEFWQSLENSIRLATAAHSVEYLPGCVELGDFDSTSTTIALWPCGGLGRSVDALLRATFDRYWIFFQDRARPETVWDAYTPYELRHVGAFVRLGRPERAHEALAYFFTHQRPQGWNHWAEVVCRDPRFNRYLGDMPHTWCGSDYINSVRAMFAYEDEAAGTLHVFAGIPAGWASSASGVAVTGLKTHYGDLHAAASRDAHDDDIIVTVRGATAPGGVLVHAPYPDRPSAVLVDGAAREMEGPGSGFVRVKSGEATIRFEYQGR